MSSRDVSERAGINDWVNSSTWRDENEEQRRDGGWNSNDNDWKKGEFKGDRYGRRNGNYLNEISETLFYVNCSNSLKVNFGNFEKFFIWKVWFKILTEIKGWCL